MKMLYLSKVQRAKSRMDLLSIRAINTLSTKRMSMNARIFVSYAHEDQNPAVALVSFLNRAGFETWFDKQSLLAGQDWRKVIKNEIKSARLLILCFSRNSVSKTGFIQEEMRLACEQARLRPSSQVYIMPVRLDDCDIPDEFDSWHCLDLRTEDASIRLLESIQSATGDGARASGYDHKSFASAIESYTQRSASESPSVTPLSEAAQELLELMKQESNLEERGIVKILKEIVPGTTYFFPKIMYGGQPLGMKSRIFRYAIDELIGAKILHPAEFNESTNTETYEYLPVN